MDSSECDALFSSIDALLTGHVSQCAAMDFWRSRPFICGSELAMIRAIADEPLCPEILATQFQREACRVRELMEALVAVGIVERRGAAYTASEVTDDYLRAADAGAFSSGAA